ncbi:hypothetical protein [Candidatus Bathycorpusculum sp.]|uniref:hypothetical protein n=1 Tax=Candidatus Bathycorpusculum sp. TaxID=2994959 RepID=UPI002821A465|nr:hypothetical protein [Candidatus Termitimicrobium sp.]MCL2685004.1 hypothetical protein [Candidatus Termitimicrobium sp.]
MKINLTTHNIAVIAICSSLYAAFGYATAQINFLGVAFLPAVVIPAVFAVLYGPWVGGISGAMGIFIMDIFSHGNPLLSLIAGVPANFILFFLIGYLSAKNISLKQALTCVSLATAGLLILSIVLLPDIASYGMVSTNTFLIIFISTIIVSLIAIAVVSIRWKEWRSYAIGAVVGQITGGLLLSVTVWLVSPLFLVHFKVPFDVVYVLPLFVWTVATEIPFILLAGPPIIKAVKKVLPALAHRNKRT